MAHEPSQPPAPESPRPLPVLRGMIDAVDREMLELLARRSAIVSEVAAFKRQTRTPIRDFSREREIISDRRARSSELGLPPQVVESVFRLVLAASREQQAQLKAQVAPDVQLRRVAIIGGKGQMGQCMARIFGDLGHTVVIADVDTELTAMEAARSADVVVISVPIDRTVSVVREIGPQVRDGALLMDVTSIKSEPVRAMLESTGASVVGTHPLFGPSVHTVQGQRIVLTPGRGDEWLAWVRGMLTARGLVVHETTPEDHDEAMSIVQVLTHFSTQVMGCALADLNRPIEQTLAFTSPVYLMELLMTARHFAQSPALYASIQMNNPQRERVTGAFVRAAGQLAEIIATGDREKFTEIFERVGRFFGPFTDQAMEQSSYLIDRMVERS